MKKIPVIVWLPLVFIAGGLVGYYGPAEELRARDAREQEEKAKKSNTRNAFGSFTVLVNIPDVAKRPRRVKDTELSTNATAVATTAVATTADAATADEQFKGTNATAEATAPRRKRVAQKIGRIHDKHMEIRGVKRC